MNSVSLLFRVPPKKQAEVRLRHGLTGSSRNAILATPVVPTRQTALSFQNVCSGIPVTATIATPHSTSSHAQLRSANNHSGKAVTATLAVLLPSNRSELKLRHDRAGRPVDARLEFSKLPTQTATLAWNADRKTFATATICFRNDYHNLVTSSIRYNYDWKTIYGTSMCYRHRSLVQGGWRILAKNLETDEVIEIGFIEANDKIRTLENISLPDGDYEISVLTSSLFWKDSMDGNIRTISVGPGEEISPLPVIYNLRSSISLGTRTIQWSASQREIDECVFGIWYSNESPIDTNRTPDATVWYDRSMSEYQTVFAQKAPAWVAVAAIHSDNSEKGKTHELFLDWSNTVPRPPDDVMVLHEPLSAVDTNVLERSSENIDSALAF